MEKIDYKTFSKIEVKIGTILEAEIVPEADRLLKLQVDLGEEAARQIVSGIREYVTPEDIIGKQFPFVTNLEPREILGYQSNGMIFAGGDKETFTLLSPVNKVPPGTLLH
jgi:methionyl-tRNA synthetase